jgi:hypothetical protein
MTTDLDSRLNLAASSLRRSVADLPLAEPRRPGSQRRVAAGLGVLVLTGVFAATLVARSGDGAHDLEVNPTADVQALIAGDVPEGFEVAWAGEQSAHVAAGAEAGVETDGDATAGVGATTAGPVDLYTYLYGDANAAAPFAASDVVVNVWDSSVIGAGVDTYGDADIQASGLDVASIRGVQGLVGQVAELSIVRWYETQDLEVVLASHSLPTDQLLAIASGLVVDGTDIALGELPAGLPGTLDEVAALGGTTVAGVRATTAKWVGYTGAADLSQVLDITTLSGGNDELMALLWELGPTREVMVRGQQAYIAVGNVAAAVGEATGTQDVVQLVWQEASGALVHVTSLGLSQDDVLSIVNGLVPSTEDAWAAVTDLAAEVQAAAAAATDDVPEVPDVAAEAGSEAGEVADTATGAVGEVADTATGVVAGAVTELESTLHDDLGGAAVVGTAGDALDSLGLGGITGSADAEASTGGLLGD